MQMTSFMKLCTEGKFILYPKKYIDRISENTFVLQTDFLVLVSKSYHHIMDDMNWQADMNLTALKFQVLSSGIILNK